MPDPCCNDKCDCKGEKNARQGGSARPVAALRASSARPGANVPTRRTAARHAPSLVPAAPRHTSGSSAIIPHRHTNHWSARLACYQPTR
uniref:Metallothionein n=1 Tax=Scylla paramamosain TaxID=85552 RepID=D2DSI2_SCYPA|nr:metallothionein [Scylla paramamosain]